MTAASRWALASRVLAGVVGSYAFTSLLTTSVSLLLPALGVPRAQSVLVASMGSFLVYSAVVMAVFHARSAGRAWRGLVLASVLPALILVWRLPGALE